EEIIVVVGFTRFGTYAVARAPESRGRGVVVFADAAAERAAAGRVPLCHVGLDADAQDAFEKLGVRTVEDFVRLPPAGILRRYGPDAHRLHQLASGTAWAPLQPLPPEESLERWLDLDEPESDRERLLFLVKRLLD